MTSHPRHQIPELLPRAGFIWPPGRQLLSNNIRNRRLARALIRAGISLKRDEVEAALAAIFDIAKDQHEQGALRAAETVPYFLAGIRRLVPFANGLDEGVFIDLFTSLRDGRREWHANPRPPFDVTTHGPLAKAIDAFNSAAAQDWNETEVELFELVGGYSDAESEGDAMEVDEDQEQTGTLTQQAAQPQETRSSEHIARLLNQLLANHEADKSKAAVDKVTKDFEDMDLDEDDGEFDRFPLIEALAKRRWSCGCVMTKLNFTWTGTRQG